MARKLILVCCLLCSTWAMAQRNVLLQGVVKDSITGEPLEGASISLNFGEVDSKTDKKGNFSLYIPTQRDFSISVKYVGYRPYRKLLQLTEETTLEINLNQLSNELEEVIVASKSSSTIIQKPLLGVSSLNIKTLRKLPTAMGEVDILRGLQMLPGVSSVGEAANGVNIRGGTTDQNLMLLDGAPIFNPTHMFGLFSAFPAEAVSGFDLYKGNVPARFGGRTAAVLDVSMTRPSLDQFSVEGGISLVSNRIKADIPILKDKLGIMVSGRGAFNDFILPLVSQQLDNIRANFSDLAGKVFWKVNNKNTITASSYYSRDFFQTELLGNFGEFNASNTQYLYSTLNYSVQWFTALKPNLNMQTSFVSSDYVPTLLLPEPASENSLSITSGIDFKQAKTNLNWYKGKQNIEFGLDLTAYGIEPGTLDPGTSPSVRPVKVPQEQSVEAGIFVENQIDLTEKLTVSGGLRYSYFLNLGPSLVRVYDSPIKDELSLIDTLSFARNQVINTYGGLEPRFGLRYNINSKTTLKFGYNLMRQYVQVVSNTATPLPTSRWKTSDTHIQPQVGSLVSAGYFHQFTGNVYELSLEGYYRFTDNIIDYRPGANFLLQQFPEGELLQGINRSYGVEFMLSKKKGEMTGWLNYTFARSFNQVNEGPAITQQVNFGDWYAANYDRPHTVNASVVINQGKHHDFSFNFTYSTGRPFTTPQGSILFQDSVYPFYDVRNNDRLPDYHRLDFAWNIYNPSMKDRRFKGDWTFTVYNLYGRKNAYSIFLETQGRRVQAQKLVIFGVPIVSLSYNFKIY